MSPDEELGIERYGRLGDEIERPYEAYVPTLTRKVYKYPPAKDNPGRVSSGAARDMRNKAEAHYIGNQAEAIGQLMTTGLPDPEATREEKNALKRQRKARRVK